MRKQIEKDYANYQGNIVSGGVRSSTEICLNLRGVNEECFLEDLGLEPGLKRWDLCLT